MDIKEATVERKHILVVDDNEELAETYKKMLEEHDYDVSTAINGVLALKHVLNKEIDAVICDLKMPQLEGDMFYTAVERVKPQLCERFIFVTGNAQHPKFEPFVHKVQSQVLNKPVSIVTLLKTLEKTLGQ